MLNLNGMAAFHNGDNHRPDGRSGHGFIQQHTIRGLLVPVTVDS